MISADEHTNGLSALAENKHMSVYYASRKSMQLAGL